MTPDIQTICGAFGCAEPLGRTIAGLGRRSEHTGGALLWPLPDRSETSLLVEGTAREVAFGRDGAILVLLPLEPGNFYGELAGSGGGEAQVEATSTGGATHFGSDAVVRLMESYSCVGVAITRQLSARLVSLRCRMVEAAMLSATGRIAAELVRRARSGHDLTIRPVPVFSDFAITVQSTRETVSRTISQLEKRGVLMRVEGGLKVVALHRLEELIY